MIDVDELSQVKPVGVARSSWFGHTPMRSSGTRALRSVSVLNLRVKPDLLSGCVESA